MGAEQCGCSGTSSGFSARNPTTDCEGVCGAPQPGSFRRSGSWHELRAAKTGQSNGEVEVGGRELEDWLQGVLGQKCKEAKWAREDHGLFQLPAKEAERIVDARRQEVVALQRAALERVGGVLPTDAQDQAVNGRREFREFDNSFPSVSASRDLQDASTFLPTVSRGHMSEHTDRLAGLDALQSSLQQRFGDIKPWSERSEDGGSSGSGVRPDYGSSIPASVPDSPYRSPAHAQRQWYEAELGRVMEKVQTEQSRMVAAMVAETQSALLDFMVSSQDPTALRRARHTAPSDSDAATRADVDLESEAISERLAIQPL